MVFPFFSLLVLTPSSALLFTFWLHWARYHSIHSSSLPTSLLYHCLVLLVYSPVLSHSNFDLVLPRSSSSSHVLTMVSAILSAAVLFGAAAEAIQYKPARATVLPEIPGNAMSPKPTAPPELRRRLGKRETDTTVYFAPDNTCGFLSGREGES